MPSIVVGLASAIGASLLALVAGHGLAMVLLAYVLGGLAGTLLCAWRMFILSENSHEAASTPMKKPLIAAKDKSVGPY